MANKQSDGLEEQMGRLSVADSPNGSRSSGQSPIPLSSTSTSGSNSPTPSRSTAPSSRSRSFNTAEQSSKKRMQMKIRKLLKPYAFSDPGFCNADLENADEFMLEEIVLQGWDKNSAASALVACGNNSVEDALDILREWEEGKRERLGAIHEDEGLGPTTRGTSSSAVVIASSNMPMQAAHLPPGYHQDSRRGNGDVSEHTRTRGKTPVESDYGSRTPTPSTPVQDTFETSPVSPFVHASPPPELEHRDNSPFSAPYSSMRETPPAYARDLCDQDGTLRIRSGHAKVCSDWGDSGVEEEPVLRRAVCSPEACKFYIEQHMENVIKAHMQRQQRRLRLEQEMAKRNLDEQTSEQMRRILAQKETNYLRLKRAKMDKSLFDSITTLGAGAFGTVDLVRKKDTGVLYAMKTLRKVDVLKKNQVAHVKAERDILAEADNEWVVKLFFSFKDAENLYFVIEYIPGGDMMGLLMKLGTFPEHLALFYTAELVCAIESVHRMGFIHRDIKPDNILIDVDGHIKLTDFGLCTGFRWTHQSQTYETNKSSGHKRQGSMDFLSNPMEPCSCQMQAVEPPSSHHNKQAVKVLEKRRAYDHRRCTAHSLVGTPNYIACEVLRRQGYTQSCDWWSVGVILYEMLVGHPPFYAPTPADTQTKIIHWSRYLTIPPQAQMRMTPESCDLILRLVQDPEQRLGVNGADEIKSHPFFKVIDWSVGIRNYEPPYIPKITHDLDTSHFDQIPAATLQSRKAVDSSAALEGPEYAFSDWTFRRFWLEERLQQNQERQQVSQPHPPSYPSPSQSQNASSSNPPTPPKETKAKPQPIYV